MTQSRAASVALHARPEGSAAPARASHRRVLVLPGVLVAIGVVAFLARLSIMVRGGGLTGVGGYDDGVYYAAADALVHGRLPYRDFLLIQPPLIAVVTAPFAALGAMTSDPAGFAIARIAFMSIGAANAVLCGWILRRFGWSAVVVGGLSYAVFHPAVYAERSVLLEPLGTLGVLLAVLMLQRASLHPRLVIVAGIAAGLSTGAKIWYVVPAMLLLVMAKRAWLRYLVGVAIGGCAIYLPFLFAAPQRIVQQVILDQLGRAGGSTPNAVGRLKDILGAGSILGVPMRLILLLLAAVALAAVIAAFLTPGARILGVLAVGTLAVLLLAPSWFPHYAALTAPPLALCLGVGAARLASLLRTRWSQVGITAVLVLSVVGLNATDDLHGVGTPTPTGVPAAAADVQGCITSDDPGALIEMNVLSRDLSDPSCEVWPDVSGWTYDPKDLARDSHGYILNRPLNTRWQHDVITFLESGDATIRIRHATGYSSASRHTIDAGAVLFRDHNFVVHATHH